MVSFDPYLNWLGIPVHEQPPNFYRLLGVVLFESNPAVIEQASDRQSLRVGAYQAGPQGEVCQQLLSEIARARYCLLDPRQKASYDEYLQGILSQRGERTVSAPPPPQFAPPRTQFAPQNGGPVYPGNTAAQRPMPMPGPPPPMQPPMPGASMPGPPAMPRTIPAPPQPVMPSPQQPMLMPAGMPPPQQAMQMPRAMSAPPGFAPARPRPVAPAAVPAAPFPTATAAAPAPVRSPAAPPTQPPAAPQRPIDELESLTSQPSSRHRIVKKKKEDYTQEILLVCVATAAVVLLVIYIAVTNLGHSQAGYDAIKPEKPTTESPRAKLDEERKEKEKEIEKQKQAAHGSAGEAKSGPVVPFGENPKQTVKRTNAVKDVDAPLPTPHTFGGPTRAMDSPQ